MVKAGPAETAGRKRPLIGISIGDPAGIGPEICVKALSRAAVYGKCVPVVFAGRLVLEDALALTGTAPAPGLNAVANPRAASGKYGIIDFVETAALQKGDYAWGEVGAASGEAAFRYVEAAIGAALAGEIAAVVTGPISKEAINLAGHHFAGHTEIFAHYTGAKDYRMLLTAGGLNVIHATTHVSLREACGLITRERVYRTIRLGEEALRLMGRERRRIAVAGLNPHASENGLFGDEEVRAIIPAVEQARSEGLDVSGPLPPDTVFVKALGGAFDLVAAMYHDQGHIPVKLRGFRMNGAGRFTQTRGVNAAIGLPVIRTSVDHGTAFDRAGKNEASEDSLLDAIDLAVTFIKNRDKAKGEAAS